jgi:hypothetical protein
MFPRITATAVIVGTVLILLLPSTVFATKDGSGSSTFKVDVYGSGINSDTGELFTEVILESGASESDTLIPGDTGRVFLGQFVFDRDESDLGETFQACVTDQDSGLSNCNTGVNHEKNAPEEIAVRVQDDNGFSNTLYRPNERSFEVEQEHDFNNEQKAQCNIRGDNNRCEIDQDNSFSDTVKDVGNSIGKLFNNYD